jgi:hypothetical protein
VIAFVMFAAGVLFGLGLATANARKGHVRLQAAVTHDQDILKGLAPGSASAVRLKARIQTSVLLYTTGWVTPRMRRGAAVMALLMAGLISVVLSLPWRHHPVASDLIVYPLVLGVFTTQLGMSMKALLHRNHDILENTDGSG